MACRLGAQGTTLGILSLNLNANSASQIQVPAAGRINQRPVSQSLLPLAAQRYSSRAGGSPNQLHRHWRRVLPARSILRHAPTGTSSPICRTRRIAPAHRLVHPALSTPAWLDSPSLGLRLLSLGTRLPAQSTRVISSPSMQTPTSPPTSPRGPSFQARASMPWEDGFGLGLPLDSPATQVCPLPTPSLWPRRQPPTDTTVIAQSQSPSRLLLTLAAQRRSAQSTRCVTPPAKPALTSPGTDMTTSALASAGPSPRPRSSPAWSGTRPSSAGPQSQRPRPWGARPTSTRGPRLGRRRGLAPPDPVREVTRRPR